MRGGMRWGILVEPANALDASEAAAKMVNVVFMLISILKVFGKFTLHLQQIRVERCAPAFS